jgi:hypothetical protein
MRAAKAHGAVNSFDLNYRAKLWAPIGGLERAQQVLRRIVGHVDALIGNEDPFLFLSRIPPNTYLVKKCFDLLTRWQPGGIYPKTLSIVLGVLQNAYSSPRDGYKIHPLSVADVDNLGKHLEKEKGQNDPRNRCVLDILEKIGALEGLLWDETIETVARQAIRIRGSFFDNTKLLEDCIPQVLLIRGDYLDVEVGPRSLFEN